MSPIETTTDLIAEGLAGRMHLLVRALDRLDRLESGSGEWLAYFNQNELPQAATELSLRALRTASDSTNYQILALLAANTTLSLNDLMSTTSLGRLTLSERLNDLVQIGLASRLIDTDHAQITAAGAELVRWIGALVGEVINHMENS